jgi:aquaporin Z
VRALRDAVRAHWPEALMEAAELALFMLSATAFTVLLEHPASPAHAALPDPFARRALMGLAMGATAVAITLSPIGQQSGAHFNPALTFAFFRLGKIAGADTALYAAAQFAGGIAGVVTAALLLGPAIAAPSVSYAVTVPGPLGPAVAFAAEAAISFGLMLVVLAVSNSRHARWTPFAAGALVATWITFEAPLSGMSMNPARTLGSAVPAGVFTALWVYFAAPALGMLLAAEVFRRVGARVYCAKVNHHTQRRCIFRCGYHEE